MTIGRSSGGCGTRAGDDSGIEDESAEALLEDKDDEYTLEVVESQHL